MHSSANTLRSRLHRTRPEQLGGVYIVPCRECPSVYIGQTGRPLETRIREHKYNVRRGYHGSGLYKHVYDTNHAISWDEARWVWRCGNEKRRLVVESALIQQVTNMNLTTGVSSVTPAASHLILRHQPEILEKLHGLGGNG